MCTHYIVITQTYHAVDTQTHHYVICVYDECNDYLMNQYVYTLYSHYTLLNESGCAHTTWSLHRLIIQSIHRLIHYTVITQTNHYTVITQTHHDTDSSITLSLHRLILTQTHSLHCHYTDKSLHSHYPDCLIPTLCVIIQDVTECDDCVMCVYDKCDDDVMCDCVMCVITNWV